MVVANTRWRDIAAAGLLCLSLSASALADEPGPRLSDAWLTTLQGSQTRVAWSHAFALREPTAQRLESQRKRLINELETLLIGARVAGNATLSGGLAAWRQALAETPALPARTPGRHDLPWLGANLRHDPPLSQVRHWGYCKAPGWVELWHLGGISRLDWRPGMTLDHALDALPGDAYKAAQRAVVIAPNGVQASRGIAAWNHQATPLTPGTRVMVALPEGRERSGGLPVSVRQEIAIINERLPAYLATRLPGDECTLQGKGEEE
ncbi:capsule biosynthesis GfcC family protein [Halomonas mongoliensis]|uniref:capsule biosynthesis GfcC family protein n=1 Tax=Halomonas mongoliensis TaxID=321265 RepID=UPI00403B30AD